MERLPSPPEDPSRLTPPARFVAQFQSDWCDPPYPPPGAYTVTRDVWDTCPDPRPLALALPDIALRPFGRFGHECVPPRRFRLLAAALFRRFMGGFPLGHELVAQEFAAELERADWLDRDLPAHWRRAGRDFRPPHMNRLLDLVSVGPMTVRQFHLAHGFLADRTSYRHEAPGPAGTPCRKTAIIDLIFRLRQTTPASYLGETDRRLVPPHVETHDRFSFGACQLIRESFRGPGPWPHFRREWRTDTVLALRRQMTDREQLGALPILADALQDAGCDDEELLEHLRGPGPHTTGCWALEAVGD